MKGFRLTSDDKQALLDAHDPARYPDVVDFYFGKRPWEGWPIAVHFSTIPNQVVLGGAGCGKTTNICLGAAVDCMTIPGFEFLDVSITAKQANLMYEMLEQLYAASPRFAKFVKRLAARPWPIVEFRSNSRMQFMTLGHEAEHIRGLEADHINIDEGGFLPQAEIKALSVIRSRLRGVRLITKRPRLGKLTVTTTPTNVQWLREWYAKGDPGDPAYTPGMFQSYRARTDENPFITPDQLAAMLAAMPEEDIPVELNAQWPTLDGKYFTLDHVLSMVDYELDNDLREKVKQREEGYTLEENALLGIFRYGLPYDPNHTYVLAGDPGNGNPPKRNAGVVGVYDLDEERLVYFDWVSGNGSYRPWLNSMQYALMTYAPMLKALDATGPQKGLHELGFLEVGIDIEGLSIGGNKYAMLNALRMLIQENKGVMPDVTGIRRQMTNYELPDEKLSQDIVSMLAVLAHLRYIAKGKPVTESDRHRMRRILRQKDSRKVVPRSSRVYARNR